MPKTIDLDRLRDFTESSRETLNGMSTADVIVALGAPDERTVYAAAPGWNVGDGRPDLASEDPAVMQAIGRCAAYKSRLTFTAPLPLVLAAHPGQCAWCDFPIDELLKACAWAVWNSRFVTASVLEWQNEEGNRYARPGDRSGYQNPEWRRFFDLDAKERERRIEVSSGRERE